ncbi:MAG TPA: NosD domain-containing protein, partial [Candidatus Bathyarchaeia archaeon]
IPTDAGAVALINCINITVQDLELSRTGQGILLAFTTGSTIQRNNITKCDNGIRVQSSSNNTLAGNSIYACTSGLSLYQSSNNTLRNNTVSDSLNNGVFVFLSPENRFSYNSFSNKKQLQIDNLANYWDDGKEGNYWSDYAGTDANGDGIGDMPYSINANNTDRYPIVRTSATQSTNSSVVDRAGNSAQTESTSTYQSEASAPIEETTVIDEEPNSSDEERKEPFTQSDQPLSAAIIPITLLLGTAVGIAFVAPLYLLRRKR